MSLIQVDCELHYQVTVPTSFLFHVTPANTPHQAVQHEDVKVEPPKEYNIAYLGAEDNRVFRVETMPCELTLRYQAKVILNPSVDNAPQIPETDHPAVA